jgi:uncharacterized membrane protein YhaH (DUF805 family)
MDWKTLLFSFEGRIGRLQYFMGSLALAALLVVVPLLGMVFGIFSAHHTGILGLLTMVLLLIVTVPLAIWAGWALAVKRVHDRDHNWYFVFIGLIPFIGSIWLFVELQFLRGTEGANRFGADPQA